jgi:hypothetical protein
MKTIQTKQANVNNAEHKSGEFVFLPLDQIREDTGTQSRAKIDNGVVDEYAQRMEVGDEFPPVDAFYDGTDYILADGFHRIRAARRIGLKGFACTVHRGTRHDALWFSLGCNATNGLRRTPADKKRAIELALESFPDRTQDQVAKHVGCDRSYVSKVQSELVTIHKLTTPKARKGKDGKTRPATYRKRKSKSQGGNLKVDLPAVSPLPDPEERPRVIAEPIEQVPAEHTPEDGDWILDMKRLWRRGTESQKAAFILWAAEERAMEAA